MARKRGCKNGARKNGRCPSTNITRLGKGRYVLPTRRKRILTVLGLIVTKHMEKDEYEDNAD